MYLECLGTKIALVRRARGYTVADLAKKTKCSIRRINRIEEGRFPEHLPLYVLCNIATALECSLDYLCGNLYVFSVPGLNDEEDKQ